MHHPRPPLLAAAAPLPRAHACHLLVFQLAGHLCLLWRACRAQKMNPPPEVRVSIYMSVIYTYNLYMYASIYMSVIYSDNMHVRAR